MSEAFNPDYLRQHLRPLAAAEADAAVLAYQAYYGLDSRRLFSSAPVEERNSKRAPGCSGKVTPTPNLST